MSPHDLSLWFLYRFLVSCWEDIDTRNRRIRVMSGDVAQTLRIACSQSGALAATARPPCAPASATHGSQGAPAAAGHDEGPHSRLESAALRRSVGLTGFEPATP